MLHSESAHDHLAPSDLATHLLRDHKVRARKLIALVSAVTPGQLATLAAEADSNGDELDRLQIVHEQLHAEAGE